jgi:hypothetical protein
VTIKDFPQELKRFEIEAYKKPKSLKDLKRTHVPFSGSLVKHPYDSKKVILVIDPFSSHTSYYEFKSNDISYAEELPSIVNLDGETITIVRIWVRKLSMGIRCSPFLVEETKI